MKLKKLLKQIRPLPWPVNAKVEEKGALTFEQLAATRIYRRHAANVLPELLSAAKKYQQDSCRKTCIGYHSTACADLFAVIDSAENVEIEK